MSSYNYFEDPTEQFVQIHNAFFDELMPRLAPPAFKIVCLIFRKTKGWNKDIDQISFSQIMRGTGIKSSATVSKHIKYLRDIGAIICQKGDDIWDANSYSLNLDFDTSTLKNEVESTLKNEVDSTLKNEDTKDSVKNNKKKGASPTQPSKPDKPIPLIDHEADWLLQNHNGHSQTEIDGISQIETFWRKRVSKDVKSAMALFYSAAQPAKLNISIPRDKATQGKWGAGAKDHLDNYTLDELKTLYPLAIKHATEREWDIYSPQSVTTALLKVKGQVPKEEKEFNDPQWAAFEGMYE